MKITHLFTHSFSYRSEKVDFETEFEICRNVLIAFYNLGNRILGRVCNRTFVTTDLKIIG